MKAVASLAFGCLVVISTSLPAQQNTAQRAGRPEPFQNFFQLPGIEFSAEQQEQVAALREEFVPRLTANQQKWDGVITDAQRRARNEAMRQARDAGKQGRELREAVDAAVVLSEEQIQQRGDIQRERDQIVSEIRTKLTALLTDQQRAAIQQPRQGQQGPPRRTPTHADLKYGPHARNVMDVWLAKSDQTTPVLVSIHGGGFRAGNKSVDANLLNQCLDAGISVVAITYRFSSDAIAPAQFHDGARAVQFIRHNAKEWNLDPTRIAATGGSAGAGISLWLGFHDDLADPDNADPVLRQSSRLTCMVVSAGQTSYDPRFIRDLFPGTDTFQHSALAQLYGVDLNNLDNLPAEKYRLFEECSPLHHLTKDDAPAMLNYGGGFDQEITNVNIGIHHAKFGKVLKEKMDEFGIRCVVNAGRETLGADQRVTPIEFLKQNFGMAE